MISGSTTTDGTATARTSPHHRRAADQRHVALHGGIAPGAQSSREGARDDGVGLTSDVVAGIKWVINHRRNTTSAS